MTGKTIRLMPAYKKPHFFKGNLGGWLVRVWSLDGTSADYPVYFSLKKWYLSNGTLIVQ